MLVVIIEHMHAPTGCVRQAACEQKRDKSSGKPIGLGLASYALQQLPLCDFRGEEGL